jgi:putative DNA primase/helicase
MNELLEAALSHHDEGRSVIAVNQDKRPYHQGWNQYFTRAQTEEEARQEFANGADGIALILYPSCVFCVLDFDGPHADDAWASTGIKLPPSARIKTRSGGKHLYYRMPADAPQFKRAVRIVKAPCDCKKSCGVDLLVHGYALIPPSPGYSEDPNHPLESAVEVPIQIIALALKNNTEPPKRTGDVVTGKVSHGERKSVLISLAGTMRARGMSIDAIRAGLQADNLTRFDPPMDERDIEDVLRSAEKWGDSAKNENYTDLGNAQRFCTFHEGNVFYSQIRKKWIIWNGNYWQWDETGEIYDLARVVIQSLYASASIMDNDKDRKKFIDVIKSCESRSRIDNMLTLAQKLPPIRTTLDRFDNHPFLINTKNCTVNLQTGKAWEFSREDYLTKSIPIDFDPAAQCPKFLEFLDEITVHRQDLAAFILRAAAYSITGDTGKQCFFILHGNGANGKSTLILVMKGILGNDYWREIKADVLIESKNDNTDDYHLAELAGTRFVAASESGKRKTLKVNLIKQATSGEPISARRPYELPFQYTPNFKIWFSTNNKPNIADNGEAFWRRLFLIPFDHKYESDLMVDHYENTLLLEAPGILNLLIRHGLDYQLNGLAPPEVVRAKLNEYQQQEDTIHGFIADMCEEFPTFFDSFGNLFAAYKKWCEENGERYDTAKGFGTVLGQKGFESYPGSGNVKMRRGLRLISSQPV